MESYIQRVFNGVVFMMWSFDFHDVYDQSDGCLIAIHFLDFIQWQDDGMQRCSNHRTSMHHLIHQSTFLLSRLRLIVNINSYEMSLSTSDK